MKFSYSIWGVWRRYLKQIQIGNFEGPVSEKISGMSRKPLVSTKDGIRMILDVLGFPCSGFTAGTSDGIVSVWPWRGRSWRGKGWKVEGSLRRRSVNFEWIPSPLTVNKAFFLVLLLLFQNHKLFVESYKTNGISFVFDIWYCCSMMFTKLEKKHMWCNQCMMKTALWQKSTVTWRKNMLEPPGMMDVLTVSGEIFGMPRILRNSSVDDAQNTLTRACIQCEYIPYKYIYIYIRTYITHCV